MTSLSSLLEVAELFNLTDDNSIVDSLVKARHSDILEISLKTWSTMAYKIVDIPASTEF